MIHVWKARRVMHEYVMEALQKVLVLQVPSSVVDRLHEAISLHVRVDELLHAMHTILERHVNMDVPKPEILQHVMLVQIVMEMVLVTTQMYV